MIKALLTVVFVFAVHANADDSQTGLKVGEKAPCVVLHQLTPSGETNGCIADSSDTQKFTIVNFMSIYCSYCMNEMPMIAALNKDLGKIAAVRSVSIERAAYEGDVRKWYSQALNMQTIDYPLALDSERNATIQWKIQATPTTYVVSKKGIILWGHVGEITADEDAQIRAIVK